MKITKLLILTFTLSLNTVFAHEKIENNSSFPDLEGSYLGQKPPGLMPELFAPDIIKTKHREAAAAFSPDLKEFYFRRRGGKYNKNTLVVIKYKDDQWIESVVPPYAGEPFISQDNKILYLGKKYRERTKSGWSEVKSLDDPFKDIPIMRLTASSNGTYYFDTIGSDPIRYSRLIEGKHEKPRTLNIEMGKWNAHPFIAPDESYLIWDHQGEGGFGKADIYISFRQQDGSWGAAINLGDKINTEFSEAYGSVSSDGKYFFFNRGYGGDTGDIFWMDAQIIETLRPKSTSYTIAYGSIGSDNVEIYLGDTEGKSNIKSTNAKGGYLAWSPDGNQFAFYAKYDEEKTWSIHTMNIDGTNRKRLTHATSKWDSAPAWSPDGKKIAFAREYQDSEGIWQAEIWIMNSDGSELIQIKSLKGSNPYFAPDGRIVFSSEFKDKKSEISIADIDGNNIIQLTNNESEEWHPEVSPDGKQIAFMSDRDENYEIYVMNIDGSNQKRLTNNNLDDWYPFWSPDGSKLIFASVKDYQKEKHIYIMNKDGSSVKKIISNSGYAVFQR